VRFKSRGTRVESINSGIDSKSPTHSSAETHPTRYKGPWAAVSVDRPYGREAQLTSVGDDPLTIGAGEYLPLEFPLAYWLEQHGYDVSYCCNSDMLTPDRGLKCKTFISVGHDEYWDIRQFRSVSKMRDEGVSLMFLSGNSVCWVTPLRAGFDGRPNRIMYRGGPYGGDRPIAMERAKTLADNSQGQVGALTSASQGVFQITPVDSTQVTDYGTYDTTTITKNVKAVVTLEFRIEK